MDYSIKMNFIYQKDTLATVHFIYDFWTMTPRLARMKSHLDVLYSMTFSNICGHISAITRQMLSRSRFWTVMPT